MQTIMTEESDHKALVEKAQQGDRAAFDELTRSAASVLLERIRRRIGVELRQRLDPEDVLQEAFLRGFRSIDKFEWRGHGSFESWVYGIALKIVLHTKHQMTKCFKLGMKRCQMLHL